MALPLIYTQIQTKRFRKAAEFRIQERELYQKYNLGVIRICYLKSWDLIGEDVGRPNRTEAWHTSRLNIRKRRAYNGNGKY